MPASRRPAAHWGFVPLARSTHSRRAPRGYKALVCVFLFGGNDANNTLIPFDTTGYGNYSSIARRSGAGAKHSAAAHSCAQLCLESQLCPTFKRFSTATIAHSSPMLERWSSRSLAPNICPARLRPRIFSPIPTSNWSGKTRPKAPPRQPDGPAASPMSLGASYNQGASIPMITSVAGDTLFCNGTSTTPVSVSPGNLGGASCSEGSECTARQATAQALLTLDTGFSLVQADDSITANAYAYAKTLADAVQSITPLQTVFPANNGLAAQLKQIAQIIQVRQRTRRAAPDILRWHRQLRHPRRPTHIAKHSACGDFSSACSVL